MAAVLRRSALLLAIVPFFLAAQCITQTPPPIVQLTADEPIAACETGTSTVSDLEPEFAETSTTGDLAAVEIDPENVEEDIEEEPAEDEEREIAIGDPISNELRYTNDVRDEELLHFWKNDPQKLGSISIGFADEGRIVNAEQFPCGDGVTWTVVSPNKTWGTSETIGYVLAAVERVKALHPTAPPLRINQISLREGGFFPPHRSHQNGRDVDLAFYYGTDGPVHTRAREKVIDVALTWELLKSVVVMSDVQVVLVDHRIQKVLYDHAIKIGENKAWLDSLFHAGHASLVRYARRHRDHFHVRFFNPRAQELGRRVAPLLAERPDQNMMMVRVKKGDTLGLIAVRYKSGIRLIQKTNHMRSSFLRVGQVLKVPVRGPCTQCPVPPPVFVPPRRLPPGYVAPELAPVVTSSSARSGNDAGEVEVFATEVDVNRKAYKR